MNNELQPAWNGQIIDIHVSDGETDESIGYQQVEAICLEHFAVHREYQQDKNVTGFTVTQLATGHCFPREFVRRDDAIKVALFMERFYATDQTKTNPARAELYKLVKGLDVIPRS